MTKDFDTATKNCLHNNTINSYENKMQAYIGLQRFFCHWFGMAVLLHEGQWRIIASDNKEITLPKPVTVFDMLQWGLDNTEHELNCNGKNTSLEEVNE